MGSTPAKVEVSAAGGGLARKEAVDDSGHLHHAVVLAKVVLGLGQECVLPPVAANQRDLRTACQQIGTEAAATQACEKQYQPHASAFPKMALLTPHVYQVTVL